MGIALEYKENKLIRVIFFFLKIFNKIKNIQQYMKTGYPVNNRFKITGKLAIGK
jgi:hypothetical protein